MNLKESSLHCACCGHKNIILLYQPSWKVDLMDLPHPSPSSCYREYVPLQDLLKINELLGEQNIIFKRQILNLMDSVKYFIKKSQLENENKEEENGKN